MVLRVLPDPTDNFGYYMPFWKAADCSLGQDGESKWKNRFLDLQIISQHFHHTNPRWPPGNPQNYNLAYIMSYKEYSCNYVVYSNVSMIRESISASYCKYFAFLLFFCIFTNKILENPMSTPKHEELVLHLV